MIPSIKFNIQDGNLSQLPPSSANIFIKVGVCSDGLVGTVYSFSDLGTLTSTLGQGPLAEAAAISLAASGGPVLCLPINPSSAGSASAVTHGGTGTATVAVSFAPRSTVLLKIVLGGASGTYTYATSVNGGAYGPAVTSSVGANTVAVPGTLTTLTLADQTYTTGAVWTISTLGAISLVGTGTVGWVTQASSPLDGYNVLVDVALGGAPGTGQFTYSLDGGTTTSGAILIPSGGSFAVPNTGLVLTFSGTFVLNDTYAFTTTTAGYSGSDVTTACGVAIGSAIAWSMLHLTGSASNSAGAATIAAVLSVQMAAAFNAYIFARAFMHCPIVEADATIVAAFASFVDPRVFVGCGEVAQVSPISGYVFKRNVMYACTARLAGIIPGESPGWVGRGALLGVQGIYPNFGQSKFDGTTLDGGRFITPLAYKGTPGYFIARGVSMAANGSDFNDVTRGRVMDLACAITYQAELPYLNGTVRVNPADGTIDDGDASAFEANVNAKLKSALVSGQPGAQNASAATATVNRSANILSTNNLPVTVAIVPLGLIEEITNTMGFSNPAA
jgi:hypothetical protein